MMGITQERNGAHIYTYPSDNQGGWKIISMYMSTMDIWDTTPYHAPGIA